MLSQEEYDNIFKYYQEGIYNIGNKRLVAFGDIHGDYNAFVNVLRKSNLIDKTNKWIGKDAHVVQVGDILDRKPRFDGNYTDEDSEFLIIGLILKLQVEAYLSGGGYHPIIGNHELMNIMGIFDYVSPKGFQHFKTFQERKDYFDIGNTFCKYLASAWNPIIKINNFLFCHGGIKYNIAQQYSIQFINEFMRNTLYGARINLYKKAFNEIFLGEKSILWNRDFSEDKYETLEYNQELMKVLKIYDANYMVLGHTPQSNGIKHKYNGHIFCIDTGMSKAFQQMPNNESTVHYLEVINNKIKLH